MQLTELLDSVQYITDNQGTRIGVLLDLEVWQEIVQLVEHESITTPISPSTDNDELPKKSEHGDDENRKLAMQREEKAFRKLHPSLLKQYAGKYVAICNEKLIDSDSDQVALLRRVRQEHPAKFVWIAPVNESPDEVYMFRSPRLESRNS